MVRLELSPAGQERMSGAVGANPVSLEGRLVSRTDSTITLSLTSVKRQNQDDEAWKGEQVTVPSSSIASIGLQQSDHFRTMMAVVGSAVALLALRTLVSGTGDQVTSGGTIGPPTGK